MQEVIIVNDTLHTVVGRLVRQSLGVLCLVSSSEYTPDARCGEVQTVQTEQALALIITDAQKSAYGTDRFLHNTQRVLHRKVRV